MPSHPQPQPSSWWRVKPSPGKVTLVAARPGRESVWRRRASQIQGSVRYSEHRPQASITPGSSIVDGTTPVARRRSRASSCAGSCPSGSWAARPPRRPAAARRQRRSRRGPARPTRPACSAVPSTPAFSTTRPGAADPSVRRRRRSPHTRPRRDGRPAPPRSRRWTAGGRRR